MKKTTSPRLKRSQPAPNANTAEEWGKLVREFIQDLALFGAPEHMPLSWQEQQIIVRRAVVGAVKLRRHLGFTLEGARGVVVSDKPVAKAYSPAW